MQPTASRPADLQRYTLTVPNERNVPTISVRLAVPDGINFVLVENKLGWKAHVEKQNGRIVAISFDGGSISPDFFDSFRFIAKNPVREGPIAWDVRQEYKGGEIVDWTGPPNSDTPASRTEISESAPVVDAIDVESGRTAAATATPSGPSAGTGHSRLSLILSLVAIGLAVIGLSVALLRGRPIA
jgi:uncharacterized protein YcnI